MKKNFESLLNNNIILSYIYNFFNRLNMQSCIWVLYLGFMGLNLTEIGIIEGVYHMTSVICEVPSGAVADIFGRKRTMVAGRLCVFISCLLMLFGRTYSIFMLSFALQAFGDTLNSGSDEALLYDSMKIRGQESNYMKVSSRINGIIEVASAIATVAGGIIAEKVSFSACYLTSAVLGFITLVLVVCMTEPKVHHEKKSYKIVEIVKEHFKTCFRILKKNRKLTKLILFFNLLDIVYTVLFFYSQEYYNSMGLNKIEISIIMLVVGILSTVGALCSDKIYKTLGRRSLEISVIIVIISVVCYLFYNMWISIVCFFVCSFSGSVLYPIRSAKINEEIPSEQRATLISVESFVFSIGMVLIFPLVGYLADCIK